MFTLLLRKDIARAQALADDLERYRTQLHYTAVLSGEKYLHKLSTPTGLIISFSAGCLTSLYLSRHSEQAKSLIGPLLSIAKKGITGMAP